MLTARPVRWVNAVALPVEDHPLYFLRSDITVQLVYSKPNLIAASQQDNRTRVSWDVFIQGSNLGSESASVPPTTSRCRIFIRHRSRSLMTMPFAPTLMIMLITAKITSPAFLMATMRHFILVTLDASRAWQISPSALHLSCMAHLNLPMAVSSATSPASWFPHLRCSARS